MKRKAKLYLPDVLPIRLSPTDTEDATLLAARESPAPSSRQSNPPATIVSLPPAPAVKANTEKDVSRSVPPATVVSLPPAPSPVKANPEKDGPQSFSPATTVSGNFSGAEASNQVLVDDPSEVAPMDDDAFGDFGSAEEAPMDDDDFGDFGSAEEATMDDDDFGDFGSAEEATTTASELEPTKPVGPNGTNGDNTEKAGPRSVSPSHSNPSATVVSLPPAPSPVKVNTEKDGSRSVPTLEASLPVSQREKSPSKNVKEFLQQIPNLSFMLSSKLSIPQNNK
jgi:hypothetical protein